MDLHSSEQHLSHHKIGGLVKKIYNQERRNEVMSILDCNSGKTMKIIKKFNSMDYLNIFTKWRLYIYYYKRKVIIKWKSWETVVPS